MSNYRFYSASTDATIAGNFTLFSIVNRGAGSITLKRLAADATPSIFIVETGSTFALPPAVQPYSTLYVDADSNAYSIITDGQIS